MPAPLLFDFRSLTVYRGERRVLHGLDLQVRQGEQRRALIGRALVHDPAALLLDEPTNSLDPGAVHEFRQLLRKLAQAGRTLVLVTHQVEDVIPEIERALLMRGGRTPFWPGAPYSPEGEPAGFTPACAEGGRLMKVRTWRSKSASTGLAPSP